MGCLGQSILCEIFEVRQMSDAGGHRAPNHGCAKAWSSSTYYSIDLNLDQDGRVSKRVASQYGYCAPSLLPIAFFAKGIFES